MTIAYTRKLARAQVWDVRANVLGCLEKPRTPEDISRQTGQLPEVVATALCRLEGEGRVRRGDGGTWERVLFPGAE